jgi:large subunit ribosomal protein L13
MKSTQSPKAAEIDHRWWIVDAAGVAVGRLSTQVAGLILGKGKPTWAPHVDCGDFVIVVNASKVRLTGAKPAGKVYYRYTGYPGGIRSETAGHLLERQPEELIRKAVTGMLPRNRLGRKLIGKLKVYTGADHPHVAQQPQPLE